MRAFKNNPPPLLYLKKGAVREINDLNMRVRILDHLGSVLGTDAQATEIARQCLVAMIDETRMRQKAHEKGMRWVLEMDELVERDVRAADEEGKPVGWQAMVEPLKKLALKHGCMVVVDAASIRAHCVNVMCPKDDTLAWAKNKEKGGGQTGRTKCPKDDTLAWAKNKKKGGGQTDRTKWTPEMDELLKKCVAAAEKGGKAVRYAPMVQPLKELAKKQECLVKVGTGTIREHWHRIKPQ